LRRRSSKEEKRSKRCRQAEHHPELKINAELKIILSSKSMLPYVPVPAKDNQVGIRKSFCCENITFRGIFNK